MNRCVNLTKGCDVKRCVVRLVFVVIDYYLFNIMNRKYLVLISSKYLTFSSLAI